MKFLQPLFGWLRVRTPRPPYDEQHYWDRIYRETRGRVIEWAEMSIPELETYKWGGAEGDFLMRNKKEGRLEEHLGKNDSVLVLGCGNSAMGDDLRTSGWRGKITSVDFAEECVQLCGTTHPHLQPHHPNPSIPRQPRIETPPHSKTCLIRLSEPAAMMHCLCRTDQLLPHSFPDLGLAAADDVLEQANSEQTQRGWRTWSS